MEGEIDLMNGGIIGTENMYNAISSKRDDSLLFFIFLRRGGDGSGAEREHGARRLWRRGASARHQRLAVVEMALVAEQLEGGSSRGQQHRSSIFGGVQNRRGKMLARLRGDDSESVN